MRQIQKALVGAAFAAAAAAVSATPVSLGVITHSYGTGSAPSSFGVSTPGYPSCDTLNGSSVTVRATSGGVCQRFADLFDIGALGYDTITSFELTLSYTGAKNQSFGLETWRVRPGYDYVNASGAGTALPALTGTSTNAAAPSTQTFTFTSSLDVFSSIVSGGTFALWFATSSGSAMNFDLQSASLQVFGTRTATAVPVPGSLALAGLALVALGVAGRRR